MNTVILIGRLVRDPELKYTPNGVAVCNFTLAVDRAFSKDKEADFIPIVVWGKIAEACGNNLNKGRLVAVSGRLQIRTYEKDGQKRYITEVVAGEVKFLDYKKSEKPAGQDGGKPDLGEIDLDDLPF